MRAKLILLFLAFSISTGLHAQTGFPFDNEIRAFKHQDSLQFPPKDGILFIGSSSIRKWADLESRFPNEPIIRRGVGGCELWQVVDYYTPYILFPYKPRKIFIYAGENDIAGGKTGRFVFEEFRKLWKMIHQKLPKTTIYFMSVKPSPSRAKFIGEVNIANSLIRKYLKNKKNSIFVDVSTVLFKPGTTTPDNSLFEADLLHLNKTGYDRWQKVLEPFVQ
ncbi:GDSL-type esterase/lipase family protein [Mucilaginibacter sp. L3T2-6]|uniref:GDSL-type esterase/lipase family protein n=1 Tax=Mucilaginibacter sp. L3T2-6 TaxID=3062491 RepID=UPI002676010A|nr:GDSL-type esterase/lipase family protein [Mucilaginibacter sp. L3T2-6]MDO3641415.1 GDSL-type esterase/lipase family protein [Mucilaginibacter sp. L3T2-6]MDV6213824.1 GDSL-type esterase/lipase family protein [Mucilaginibacter sp. L3T2-6]